MNEGQKVIKSGGHCYGPCGAPDCAFWLFEAEEPRLNRPAWTSNRCALFGNAEKDHSRALHACDKLYGYDYEGRA